MCTSCMSAKALLAVPRHVGHFFYTAGAAAIRTPGYLCGRVVTGVRYCGQGIHSGWKAATAKTNMVAQSILLALLACTGIVVKKIAEDGKKAEERIKALETENQELKTNNEKTVAELSKRVQELTDLGITKGYIKKPKTT